MLIRILLRKPIRIAEVLSNNACEITLVHATNTCYQNILSRDRTVQIIGWVLYVWYLYLFHACQDDFFWNDNQTTMRISFG